VGCLKGGSKGEPLARVGGVRYDLSVTAAPWDLLDRLDAAAEDAAAWHHDLCAQFDGAGSPCSCGGPALLREIAAWMRSQAVDAAVSEAQRAA